MLSALTFILLTMLPVNFSYLGFAALIFLNSVGMGMLIAPNQTGIMNSLPANQRGAGAGMAGTFNASAQVLSIGIFFSLMILGLAATLPSSLYHGLVAQGVSPTVATRVSHLPPVGSLFAAFLGYNPMQVLLGHAELSQLPHSTAAYSPPAVLPHLIAPAFSKGLTGRSRSPPAHVSWEQWHRCSVAASITTWKSRRTIRRQLGPRSGGRGRDRVIAGRLTWPSRHSATGRGRLSRQKRRRPASVSVMPRPGWVSARTLRYYEELGLLTPSLYTPGGERRYTADDLTHLQRILELREVLGMNLDEIREFLALETRLDELRASVPRHEAHDKQEGAGRAEGNAPGGPRSERVAGRADQCQVGPHGRLSCQAAQRRAALPGVADRTGVEAAHGQGAYAGPVAADEDEVRCSMTPAGL